MPTVGGARSLVMQWEGIDELRAQMRKLRATGPLILARALREEGEAIVAYASERTVPRDWGTLAGTGFVREPVILPGFVRVLVGFGGASAKYAGPVHENPRAGRTGGVSPKGRRYKHWAKVGGWKYLERAMQIRGRRLPRTIVARINREWGRLLR